MSFPMSELKGIHLPEGFSLKEDGKDFLELFYGRERVAAFSSFGATPEEVGDNIRQAAVDHLKKYGCGG